MSERRTTAQRTRSGVRRRGPLVWVALAGGVVALAWGVWTVVQSGSAVADGSDLGAPAGRHGAAFAQEADRTPMPAARPSERIGFADGCVTSECHAVLGSAAHAHPTTVERRCDLCHEDDAGDHTYPLLGGPDDLCGACHAVGSPGLEPHGSFAVDGCLGCHDSHASPHPSMLLGQDVASTCGQCHPPAEGLYRHTPYGAGRCTLCHDPHEAEGPGTLLGGPGREHCRGCHPDLVSVFESVERSHLRVEGTCLGCHDEHASDYRGHLRAAAAEQCLACHEDVQARVAGATVPHGALLDGDRCLACHDPHASDRPMMLRADQAHVCLGCHGEELTATDGSTIPAMNAELLEQPFSHGPVGAGDCAACHDIHGSNRARMLKHPVSAVLKGTSDAATYALCFLCHVPDLLLAERTDFATEFRDGDENLHYLHVKKDDRGRPCTSCHAVHGSSQARHIATAVAYQGSDWRMPIGFVLTADGGRCAPGCHEQMSYTRGPAPAPAEVRAPRGDDR